MPKIHHQIFSIIKKFCFNPQFYSSHRLTDIKEFNNKENQFVSIKYMMMISFVHNNKSIMNEINFAFLYIEVEKKLKQKCESLTVNCTWIIAFIDIY